MNNSILIEKLLEVARERFAQPKRKIRLFDDDKKNDFLTDIETYPHVYILASLMDRQMESTKCIEIPYKIYQLLQYNFDIDKLANITLDEYIKMFNKHKLHRLKKTMAEVWYHAVQEIIDRYDGDAAKIWNDKPSSFLIIKRFEAFKGGGQKISTMAVNILVREYKIELSDYRDIDISVDTHVSRIMQRMGIVQSDNTTDIIETARKINPNFPGIFDFILYDLGKSYCTAKKTDCPQCQFNEYCPKIEIK